MSNRDELLVCPACKEWTTPHEDCCGAIREQCDCEECQEAA